jgi:Cys-Gly metallodipeptidase DUG1
VRKLTREEDQLYSELEFDIQQYTESLGVESLKYNTVKEFLVSKWSKPNLSIVGVQSSDTKGSVISKAVSGKISIRYVPDQTSSEIIQTLMSYVQQKFSELHSGNHIKVKVLRTGAELS